MYFTVDGVFVTSKRYCIPSLVEWLSNSTVHAYLDLSKWASPIANNSSMWQLVTEVKQQ